MIERLPGQNLKPCNPLPLLK